MRKKEATQNFRGAEDEGPAGTPMMALDSTACSICFRDCQFVSLLAC